MPLNPTEVYNQWKAKLTGSTDKIKRGVAAVQVSPMAKAAAAKDKYLQGVMNAVDSGRYEEGLMSVSLQEWQRKMIDVGVGRIASGATAAEVKMTNFLSQLLPYTEQVSKSVQAMPSTSLEDNIQRAVATMRMMSQFKYRKVRT